MHMFLIKAKCRGRWGRWRRCCLVPQSTISGRSWRFEGRLDKEPVALWFNLSVLDLGNSPLSVPWFAERFLVDLGSQRGHKLQPWQVRSIHFSFSLFIVKTFTNKIQLRASYLVWFRSKPIKLRLPNETWCFSFSADEEKKKMKKRSVRSRVHCRSAMFRYIPLCWSQSDFNHLVSNRSPYVATLSASFSSWLTSSANGSPTMACEVSFTEAKPT